MIYCSYSFLKPSSKASHIGSGSSPQVIKVIAYCLLIPGSIVSPSLPFITAQTYPVLSVYLCKGTIVGLPVLLYFLIQVVEEVHAFPCPSSIPACEVRCPLGILVMRTGLLITGLNSVITAIGSHGCMVVHPDPIFIPILVEE